VLKHSAGPLFLLSKYDASRAGDPQLIYRSSHFDVLGVTTPSRDHSVTMLSPPYVSTIVRGARMSNRIDAA
jgi:hypothetical protein